MTPDNPFDQLAPFYDSWFDLPLGQTVDAVERDLIYQLAAFEEGTRVLDVGTGTGHFAFVLARQGIRVTGVDLSAPMLAVARAKGEVVGTTVGGNHLVLPLQGRPLLVQADAAALPFANNTFVGALSVTLLEFVPHPEDVVAEMWRVTAAGGKIVVAVLNAWSPWAWLRQREPPFDAAYFFTPREFLTLLGRYGKVTWNSSVFFLPDGRGVSYVWELERWGRRLLKPFGALLAGRVTK